MCKTDHREGTEAGPGWGKIRTQTSAQEQTQACSALVDSKSAKHRWSLVLSQKVIQMILIGKSETCSSKQCFKKSYTCTAWKYTKSTAKNRCCFKIKFLKITKILSKAHVKTRITLFQTGCHTIILKTANSRAWWCTPVRPTSTWDSGRSLQDQGQPNLHSKALAQGEKNTYIFI